AFNGALVWGTANDPGPIDPDALPRIAACPVESHTQPGKSPLDRNIGSKLFPQIARVASFAHAPVGSGGYRPTNAWPNARDVIHQQMNVASIRRAYEGGLRLMFASTTDNQVISVLLTGIHFVNGFQPQADVDYLSAAKQLKAIRELAAAQSGWVEIALTPREARDIIGRGKLALVLSLEMDGLTDAQLAALWRDWGARHVHPIHLVDNDFGGSAANADLYNAASSAVSGLYRDDLAERRYLDVVPSLDFSPRLGRPVTLVTQSPGALYVDLQEVPYATFAAACYLPPDACAPRGYTMFGHQNLRGLCTSSAECARGERPGKGRIEKLIADGWLVDVSHMGARSATETVALAPDYPFIASHGDVAQLCRGAAPGCTDSTDRRELSSERALDSAEARTLTKARGVLGLGMGVGNFYTETVFVARGVPALAISASAPAGCVASADAGTACELAPQLEGAALTAPLTLLQVELPGTGPVGDTGQPAARFVRVELRDATSGTTFQRRVVVEPLQCSADVCSAMVALPQKQNPLTPPSSFCTAAPCTGSGCSAGPYTVDDVESISVEWLFLEGAGERQCASTMKKAGAALSWRLGSAVVTAPGSGTGPLVRFDPPLGGRPLATLDGEQVGRFELYSRRDRPPRRSARASGRLLQVKVTTTSTALDRQNRLGGANPQRAGANVCVAMRRQVGGQCTAAVPLPADSTECLAPWVSINQRGQWDPNVELYTFVRWEGDPRDVCGVDVAVRDLLATETLELGEVRVSAAEDPVAHWVRRYAEVSLATAGGQLGVVALGTDFNGLNGMTDISEQPLPDDARRPSSCGGDDDTLAPMHFSGSDEQVRIDERGVATYGHLADFLAIVERHPGCGRDVRDSLMLSAEATLRAWEKARGEPERPRLPVAAFDCGADP
ncbi:MAG: membrane dipeptidase, partial [Myxococcaceae bacterium]|nr:membrane dipeptidase [Myxococcaceae bacterium]